MNGEKLYEVRIPDQLVTVDTTNMEVDLRVDVIQWFDQNNIDWELDFYFNPKTTSDDSSDELIVYSSLSSRMGYLIWFKNEEDALLFTLRWL